MKFNYKLHRLCGASYGVPDAAQSSGALGNASSSSSAGGNILYDSTGNVLLSPVSNRVQVVDLLSHTVRTLPVEARSNIRTMALSPDDRLLIIIDVDDFCTVVNYRRGVVLHRMRFKRRVRYASFSPGDGRYLAVTHGKTVRVWRSPGLVREAAPLVLHRTYGGLGGDVLHVEWSPDGTALLGCGRDGTAKVWTVDTVRDYVPATLSGHKGAVVGAWFEPPKAMALGSGSHGGDRRLRTIYTVSGDGAVVQWKCRYDDEGGSGGAAAPSGEGALSDAAVDFFSGGAAAVPAAPAVAADFEARDTQAHHLVGGTWSVSSRHYLNQGPSAAVTSCSYNATSSLLAVGFSTGLFGLYELPSMANVHTLSISNQHIRTVAMNPTGEWLAFGCPSANQLLVWEWRSEQHVLKQRGHAYGMRCASYSPDGVVAATGGEDGAIKLWNTSSGFCYCTLSNHTAPITDVAFANASVVLSSSLDGTVRAHDLHRYRNFKTLTSPQPMQFVSLAVDPAGEIVAAGSADPFHVHVWDLRTGKVLDVLTGHAAPVCALAFHPLRGTLASASWDGTVKVWDLYKREGEPETLTHGTDVACLAFRPDGKFLCTGTVGGLLSFWNVEDGSLAGEIDGRRDIAGGRKMNDRAASNNNAASRYFTSVCYSADGSCVLAGGNSKYVCIYEAGGGGALLRKFKISSNRSLDGVLDELNSKDLGEGGPLDDRHGSDDEADFSGRPLPGARRGDDGSRSSRVEVLTSCVAFSPTGREWSAVSGEGLHVYSLDDDMVFDPISLTESVTPGAVQSRLRAKEWGTALRMSLHLNETALIRGVVEETPHDSIAGAVAVVGREHIERLMTFVAGAMAESPHVEFYLRWCLEMLRVHGAHMERHRGSFLRAFRAMHRSVSTRYDEVKKVCDENRYTLDFVGDQASLVLNH